MSCFRRGVIGLAAAVLLSGCAHLGPAGNQDTLAGCSDIGKESLRWSEYRLYMGVPDADPSQAEAHWRAFLDEEVTPRFPDGYTLQTAKGAWKNRQSGRTIHEDSRVLILLAPGKPETTENVAAIARAYALRFGQEAVLMTSAPTCTWFVGAGN